MDSYPRIPISLATELYNYLLFSGKPLFGGDNLNILEINGMEADGTIGNGSRRVILKVGEEPKIILNHPIDTVMPGIARVALNNMRSQSVEFDQVLFNVLSTDSRYQADCNFLFLVVALKGYELEN